MNESLHTLLLHYGNREMVAQDAQQSQTAVKPSMVRDMCPPKSSLSPTRLSH